MKLIDFYKAVLESTVVQVEPNGMVKHKNKDGELKTIFVKPLDSTEKLPLVLPTKQVLETVELSKIVGFHPASESIFGGESPVLTKLAQLMNIRLMVEFQNAYSAIASLYGNESERSKLSLQQEKLVSKIPPSIKSTGDYLVKLASKVTPHGKNSIASLKLKRGGKIDGASFTRTCMLVPNILYSSKPLLGVDSAKTNLAIGEAIYNKIVPKDIEVGTIDKLAPYFVALLECYVESAKHLNGIRKTLGRYKGDMGIIDITWAEQLDNLGLMLKSSGLPQLPGNKGKTPKGEGSPEAPKANWDELPQKKVAAPDLPWKTVEEPQMESLLKEEPSSEDGNSDEMYNLLMGGGAPAVNTGYSGYQQQVYQAPATSNCGRSLANTTSRNQGFTGGAPVNGYGNNSVWDTFKGY